MTDIPPNVYWNVDASNFYSFPQAQGMGDAFFREWHARVAEFPTGPHPARCVHYRNPGQHDACVAGVAYDTFHQVPFPRRPCFLTDDAASKPGAVACASLRRPTAVEIEMWKHKSLGSLHRLFAAIAATAEWREQNAGKSGKTSLPCPTCGKPLQVVISRDGSMAGACETLDCTKWIE